MNRSNPAIVISPRAPAPRKAVALLNFGGPRTPEEIPGFLYEILRDPNTIQLPVPQCVQNRLARFIARRRAVEVTRQYAEIGGASPIVAATEKIGNALRAAPALRGESPAPPGANAAGTGEGAVPVYLLHRYVAGQAREAVRRMVAEGVTEVLALPLYPHFSYTTTGSSLEQMLGLLEEAGWRGPVSVLRSYPDAPGYLDALAQRLRETLTNAAPPPGETVVLCSAHGLPKSYVAQGDPYRLELYRTVEGLRRRFPEWRFELSFQSRVGPAEWLKPYTVEHLQALGARGVRHVVFLPLSFVNDHIETLYEIGVTYFAVARAAGLIPHRVPAVEDHPGHIAVLADAVREWRAGRAGVPVAELLPPSQHAARVGNWLWRAWWLALAASVFNAWCR
ncbi:MAG: ferrochelatase [Deltaproteobacteria bacterium]|nr:ferrochelatase [Deltaproteobacteria bacterium]